MGFRLGTPLVQQFFDSNGDPLENGTIEFFLTGTTTPTPIYSDSSGTPIGTSVTLNNFGIPQNSGTGVALFFDEAITYKIVLKDSSGTAIDPTVDPYSIATATSAYTPSATGAVERTVQAKLDESVSVKDFGATGDNVADDTAEFQLAATYTGKIHVPRGTYKITSTVNLSSNTEWILDPDAIIDFSGAPTSDTCFLATGTEGSALSISADVSKDATSVTLSSTSGLAVGDLVRLGSSDIVDGSNTSSTAGELLYIKSLVANTSVTFTTPVRGVTYTTANNAALSKLTPVENIIVRGGKLVGLSTDDNSQTAIDFVKGVNCLVENVRTEQFDGTAVEMTDCINCRVLGSKFDNAQSSGAGYGTSFVNACQDCIVANCHFIDVRHSLSVATNTSTNGISRRILFHGNTVNDSAPATGGGGGDAIDTHGACEEVHIHNNTVEASSGIGINVECVSGSIIGNFVTHSNNIGIYFHNEADKVGTVLIANNRVEKTIDTAEDGIRVEQGTRGTTAIVHNTVVANNVVKDVTGVGIYCRTTVNTERNTGLSVTGNTILNADSTVAALYIENQDNATVTGNTVRFSAAQGLRLDDCQYVTATGNSIHLDAGSSIGIYLDDDTNDCIVSANVVYGEATQTGTGIFLDNTCDYNNIIGNNVRAFATGITLGSGTGNAQADNIT